MIPVELQEIYGAYARELAQAHKKSSIFAGLLGQGSMNDPRSHVCNKNFYENTERWVDSYSISNPEPSQVFEVCVFMLEAAKISYGKPAYGYHLVTQAHVKPLIPLLTDDDRAALLEKYLKWYPRRLQLPIQLEICDLLADREGKEQSK